MRHWYTARDPEHLYPPVKPSLLKLDESIDKGEVKQSLWGKIKSCCHRVSNKDLDKKLDDLIERAGKAEKHMAAIDDALAKIDKATTEIAGNVADEATTLATMAATEQTISEEVDALKTALQNAGVSQALIDQTNALGDKLQAQSDALKASASTLKDQVPVLQAIATKGAANPVPVPVP